MIRKQAKTVEQVENAGQPQEGKRDAPKEFVIERNPSSGLYAIKYTAGGEVPDMLKGSWTNLHRAQAAIDNMNALKAKLAA